MYRYTNIDAGILSILLKNVRIIIGPTYISTTYITYIFIIQKKTDLKTFIQTYYFRIKIIAQA